jgi:hypothetical protein
MKIKSEAKRASRLSLFDCRLSFVVCRFRFFFCRADILKAPQNATLEGRAQALRRGQRGMDAALAAPGHGWPMAACPRSNAGAREPDEGGPDIGAGPFWLLFRLLEKVTRRKGATDISHTQITDIHTI